MPKKRTTLAIFRHAHPPNETAAVRKPISVGLNSPTKIRHKQAQRVTILVTLYQEFLGGCVRHKISVERLSAERPLFNGLDGAPLPPRHSLLPRRRLFCLRSTPLCVYAANAACFPSSATCVACAARGYVFFRVRANWACLYV